MMKSEFIDRTGFHWNGKLYKLNDLNCVFYSDEDYFMTVPDDAY